MRSLEFTFAFEFSSEELDSFEELERSNNFECVCVSANFSLERALVEKPKGARTKLSSDRKSVERTSL